jgi:hypothetical protein
MRTQRIVGRLSVSLVVLSSLLAVDTARAQGHGSLTTQDYIDIQQLYARYNVAIDAGNAEAYADTFTTDGVFNTFNGREALLGFARGYKGINSRHWNTNLVITPSPEGAKGSVYLFLLDVSTKPPSISTAIQYDDTLVKTSLGWRFKKRITKLDAPAAAAAPPTR